MRQSVIDTLLSVPNSVTISEKHWTKSKVTRVQKTKSIIYSPPTVQFLVLEKQSHRSNSPEAAQAFHPSFHYVHQVQGGPTIPNILAWTVSLFSPQLRVFSFLKRLKTLSESNYVQPCARAKHPFISELLLCRCFCSSSSGKMVIRQK